MKFCPILSISILVSISATSGHRVKVKGENNFTAECDDQRIYLAGNRCFEEFERHVRALKLTEEDAFFLGVDVEVIRSLCSHLVDATGCYKESLGGKCSTRHGVAWRLLDDSRKNFIALCARENIFEEYALVQHCFWEARRTSTICYHSFLDQLERDVNLTPKDGAKRSDQLHHHHHHHHDHHHQRHHKNHQAHRRVPPPGDNLGKEKDEQEGEDASAEVRMESFASQSCRLFKRLQSCIEHSLRWCGPKHQDLSADLVSVSVPMVHPSQCQETSVVAKETPAEQVLAGFPASTPQLGRHGSFGPEVSGGNLDYLLDGKSHRYQDWYQAEKRRPIKIVLSGAYRLSALQNIFLVLFVTAIVS